MASCEKDAEQLALSYIAGETENGKGQFLAKLNIHKFKHTRDLAARKK